MPVTALIMSKKIISFAAEHPKQPIPNNEVAIRKQTLRPNRSENRPYSGWAAVLVRRYDVVIREARFDARKSELMAAYVEAVTVPSKPARKTLENRAT